ncbi:MULTISPECIES: helix-turn-helix domain-containing protein [Mycolicibacterium]|uniref:helix-turn-helix domain-containing protein n=1 Tax=Mycolicibacterium TaxID=1866885 RepID=UPI0007EB3334|nr:helix-turn-helix domain-containing protein [Mycolicibacterium fortuitum]OBG09410.1 hypothetical protein A5768_15385 [Mycolicibacterium fortuitum]
MGKTERIDALTDAVTALVAALRDGRLTPRILNANSLLSIPEAANELRICRSNVYKLMARGEIRTLKLGNRTLIKYSEIIQFIDHLEQSRDG